MVGLCLFFLSIFKVPKFVNKEMIKIQRQILWRCEADKKRIAWVKWERIGKSRLSGGLGIKDIHNFNKALPEKWK